MEVSRSVFQLDPGMFERSRKRFVRRQIIITVISILVGLTIGALPSLMSGEWRAGITAFVLIGAIFLTFFALMLQRKLKQFDSAYKSFEIMLADDFVQRRGGELALLEIRRADIHSIKKVTRKGLLVRSRASLLLIPEELERFEEITTILGSWNPIENDARMPWIYRPEITVTLTIALFGVAFLVPYKWASNGSAAALIGWISYTAIHNLRSPSCTKQAKRVSLYGLYLVVVLAAKIYLTI
ncbi:MAG: hypothetical protein HYX26_06185 [Acidobacteriales bacterium]|nr:hypothetical protein [Terriglobales bacterium]